MLSAYVGSGNTRVEFCGSQIIGSNATEYNATGITFTDEWPRRWIIVAFCTTQIGVDLTQPTVNTIGGVAATLVFSDPLGVGSTWRQLWIAKVPTNADNTINATRAGTMSDGRFMAWAAYDLRSATATDTLISSSADPSSGTIDVSSGGLVVAFTDSTTALGTLSWTGVTKDDQINGTGTAAGRSISAASASKLPAPDLSITLDGSSAGNTQIWAASFR